ncbi:hypothetical protein [Enterococcus gilvus]|nr:hypothetical protein [Enterococcus gilvus]
MPSQDLVVRAPPVGSFISVSVVGTVVGFVVGVGIGRVGMKKSGE